MLYFFLPIMLLHNTRPVLIMYTGKTVNLLGNSGLSYAAVVTVCVAGRTRFH